jgi:hypothetical protein
MYLGYEGSGTYDDDDDVGHCSFVLPVQEPVHAGVIWPLKNKHTTVADAAKPHLDPDDTNVCKID